MKADKSFCDHKKAWVSPTVTKLDIVTETKAPVGVDRATEPKLNEAIKGAEPAVPATPGSKFGFSLEWSFPLSARSD
jgi:hypothetical protein